MKKQLISSGSDFENEIGYSRAVVCNDQIFVSGTTGFDYDTMTISDDVKVQAEQCIKNIERHNYHQFFKDEFDRRTDGTDKKNQSKRSMNYLYSTIYKEFIVNQHTNTN